MTTPAADRLVCMVEIPKGSRNKYELDEELGGIKLDRFLFSSVAYPSDYGIIPRTIAEDGDPLDCLVLVSEPTFPGCLIPVKVIALFKMRDEGKVDDKVVCVPQEDPNWNTLSDLGDIPEQLQSEIAHFFEIYKQPEGKRTEIEGWFSRDHAVQVVEEARRRGREAS